MEMSRVPINYNWSLSDKTIKDTACIKEQL